MDKTKAKLKIFTAALRKFHPAKQSGRMAQLSERLIERIKMALYKFLCSILLYHIL